MGTLYVREYSHMGRDNLGRVSPFPCEPAVNSDALTTSTSSGALDSLNTETRFLRLYPTEAMLLETGADGTTPTAGADSLYLKSATTIIIAVEPDTELAVKDVA